MNCYACRTKILPRAKVAFKDGKVFCFAHFAPMTEQEIKVRSIMEQMDID